MAESASFKSAAWKGASEVSVTTLGGQSKTVKPGDNGVLQTSDHDVIVALRADPSITEVDPPKPGELDPTSQPKKES